MNTDRPESHSFLPLVLLAGAATANAQPEWNVLYGHEEFRNAENMASAYIAKLRAVGEEGREKLIVSLKTPGEVSRFQAETRAWLQAIPGDFRCGRR